MSYHNVGQNAFSFSIPVLDTMFPLILFHPLPRIIERASNVSSDFELGKTNYNKSKDNHNNIRTLDCQHSSESSNIQQ